MLYDQSITLGERKPENRINHCRMENLLKQMRMKFTYEEENKADLGGSRDQKIPIQKTQSFKEKKKSLNWFQKQFARNVNRDYGSIEMDHAIAVAAAAFAIKSKEVSEQKKSETLEALFTRTKSKVDGTNSPISLLGSTSKLFSGSFRSSDDHGNMVPISSDTDEKKPEKAITPAPSMKKASTFPDKKTLSFVDKKIDDKKTKTTAPKVPPPPPPPPPPIRRQTSTKFGPVRSPTGTKKQTPTGPGIGDTNADEWERTELENIRERFDKLKETINSWENKKKIKARRKLDKEESELERRRLIALEQFRIKIMYIGQIAGGARTQAEETQKKEELKAKEKANEIRITGKLPGIFSCF
ncbi:putative remorin [Lupinus albus]|uniref:Putative remorin n=1 Tax=Lupinus albus TaxID=3870 RepID=A0A6A4P2K4_LUPAL|nr:putative remorin [Lupinus albus]